MLRITAIENSSTVVTLKLEGRLVGPYVDELAHQCAARLKNGTSLRLDLLNVSYVDGFGVTLLRQLRSQHAIVTECSPFVGELLKEELP